MLRDSCGYRKIYIAVGRRLPGGQLHEFAHSANFGYTDLRYGIDGLARKINDMGLMFGLWFEPEMVSPDSDLYRAHPDWCLHAANRRRTTARQQLTLDRYRV